MSVICDSVQPLRRQPTRLLCPCDSPGRNTGVGFHFLLHCMHACQVASAVSDSVQSHRWQPTRLVCPWVSPGENTGVGCHFLLHLLGIVNLQCCVSGIQQFTRYLIQFPELYRRFLLFIYFIYILVCIYSDSNYLFLSCPSHHLALSPLVTISLFFMLASLFCE